MKRAVITGLGIVSSIGNNQQEVLASLREGRSGITFSQELKDSGIQVGKVVFYHHGMEILLDCDGELAAAKAVLGGRVTFADDGSAYQL